MTGPGRQHHVQLPQRQRVADGLRHLHVADVNRVERTAVEPDQR